MKAVQVKIRLRYSIHGFGGLAEHRKDKGSLLLLMILFALAFSSCRQHVAAQAEFKLGAERMDAYLPTLQGKSVGFLANHSSMIGATHMVDTLLSLGIDLQAIFSPEHGFRGEGDAGQSFKDGKDVKTGLPIYSLYGSQKKPKPEMLKGIDIVVFDIQDVGARFYTYISTLHLMMEACTELGIEVLVLDRPNPNGFYIDGPILDPDFYSFVGMHPVPIVHGMTVGEYARMIAGEGWLYREDTCMLTVIPMLGWTHDSLYELPIAPSPNLKDMTAIYLYPSLCLFEGTVLSVGRGTEDPFTCIGHPDMINTSFEFMPKPMPGASKPKLDGQVCKGWSFVDSVDIVLNEQRLQIEWLMTAYQNYKGKEPMFIPFFYNLAGTDRLQRRVEMGMSAEAIRKSWEPGLEWFASVRQKYLLYEDAAGIRAKW